MSMLTKALRATGLNKPGKFLTKALPIALPGIGGIAGTALTLGAGLLGKGGGGGAAQPPIFTGSRPGPDFGDLTSMVQRMIPGGATGRGKVALVNGQCPRGYHPDKRTRSYCVRNRRMNPMNGRAAMRAARRLRGGEKMLRQVYTLLHKKPAGKIVPKTRRAR